MRDWISSLDNARLKLLRRVQESPLYRQEEQAFVLEHPASIFELLEEHPECIKAIIVREGSEYAARLFSRPTWGIADSIWGSIRSVKSSQGLLALVQLPKLKSLSELVENSRRLVVLDRIQDPVNVGAIVRSAVAFGGDGILLLPGCADPFHPYALRAMAGLCLTIPFVPVTPEELAGFDSSWTVLGLSPQAPTLLGDLVVPEKFLLILGSEGAGITTSVSYQPVSIPMSRAVDSLNVAVSAGIALFHLQDHSV